MGGRDAWLMELDVLHHRAQRLGMGGNLIHFGPGRQNYSQKMARWRRFLERQPNDLIREWERCSHGYARCKK